jgi:ABC-2 type transport system ATP-binding protein
MLEANSLTKKYGQHTALKNLNLKVDKGEVYCLLGANGAGKTTTINLFLNFIDPTSGSAKINGIDVSRNPKATKQHVAYIPENLSLYTNLTGLENLEFFTGLSGSKNSEIVLVDMLHNVGLDHEAMKKRVSEYSKGMRQKVGIAIAKAKNATNLLLDEPTSGLDPQASNEFAQLLNAMKENGVTILWRLTTYSVQRNLVLISA